MPSKTTAVSTLAIIPARFASTRFPGKPLHRIVGKPLVQHVWERCRECSRLDRIVIATDDERIAAACRTFGADVQMTSPHHPSGTDRIAEVAARFPDADILINVQGDEPLISPALIDQLAETLARDQSLDMITAAAPIHDPRLVDDPNVVKVVLNTAGRALYFSRSPIPFPRQADARIRWFWHKGIYGYRREFLLRFVGWPPSMLEMTESLEQLRALENGASIQVVVTSEESPGVDTPEQAAEVERLILTGKIPPSSASPR
ncbi:MAG: 3-deoxy-manno-octulosonate cytidylyltransferase [Verrucomicrobiales bacterium]|nr:3-deoxy-manno-octulosonate cytidylyltransferase [Verrucomicrobiales bacterium]